MPGRSAQLDPAGLVQLGRAVACRLGQVVAYRLGRAEASLQGQVVDFRLGRAVASLQGEAAASQPAPVVACPPVLGGDYLQGLEVGALRGRGLVLMRGIAPTLTASNKTRRFLLLAPHPYRRVS